MKRILMTTGLLALSMACNRPKTNNSAVKIIGGTNARADVNQKGDFPSRSASSFRRLTRTDPVRPVASKGTSF